jgi:hypothetical protein
MSRVSKKKYGPDDELRDAIAELTEIGCEEAELRAFAVVLAMIPTVEKQYVTKIRKELDRIKKKDLAQLSTAANAASRINPHRWLGPNGMRVNWQLDSPLHPMFSGFSPEQQTALEIVKIFERLPDLIRSYIHLVELQVREMRKVFNLKGSRPWRDKVKFGLIRCVEERTGRPNYERLSNFLEAFRIARGGADIEEKEFTTEALQQFYSRYRQRMQTQLPIRKVNPDAKRSKSV